jgi:hypothetical protein
MKRMSAKVLENAYWISQIGLALVALFAAVAAFAQVRTIRLFELLKYLESSEIRKARRVVFREIYPRKDQDWWLDKENGERWESAASDVCASYDILGRIIQFDRLDRILPRGGYGTFFKRHWSRSIVDNYDALEHFLEYRRQRAPNSYSAFTQLAQAARPHAGLTSSPPLQHP